MRADEFQGHGLDENVPDGRGLRRPGDDQAARGIRRELAEETVLGAPADYMDPLDRMTGGLLQLDSGDLPPALAQTRWAFSYRYPSVPFDLELSVEKETLPC